MKSISSTNPSHDYALLGSVESTPFSAVDEMVLRSHLAGKSWSHTSLTARITYLREIHDAFVLAKESLAHSVSQEMGMPIRIARDDIQYGLTYFSWYLENAEKYLSPEVTFESDSEIHTVFYEPKWLIVAITPWNYPCMLFTWACIQPLLAGNSVIWKISKEVILTGKLIADIFGKSNLPTWVWQEVYGDGVTWDYLTDQDIDGITFTGSTLVGKWLREKAYKKDITTVMELGGSAPGIVCEDADIDAILETIYFLRYSNSGQMCDGLKRLIVHESRYDELVEKLSIKLLSKKIWNAQDEMTDIGPLVSEHQMHEIWSQLQDALDWWATVLAENRPDPSLRWAYMSAYILGNISREMRVWKEEVFGPVLPIVTFRSIEEAISLANDTDYGLGGYVFTQDHDTFHHIAREIKSGMVQMNTVNFCIPQDPFGGYKSSGIGREHGKWGFYEFTNVKVISEPKN